MNGPQGVGAKKKREKRVSNLVNLIPVLQKNLKAIRITISCVLLVYVVMHFQSILIPNLSDLQFVNVNASFGTNWLFLFLLLIFF